MPEEFEEIKSRHNALLKEIRTALRGGELSARGLLPIEGPLLLREAFKSRIAVDSLLVRDSTLLDAGLQNWLRDGRARVFTVSADLMTSIADTETPSGILGLVRLPQWKLEALLPEKAALFLVLVQLQDPGNLGTIIRCAEAFGVTAVLATPETVSPFNPKAVRASAGSIFRVPIFRGFRETDLFEVFKAHRIVTVATSLRAQQSIETLRLHPPLALYIGQEAAGLPENTLAACQSRVRIPMRESVQSLNVAIATGILLYEIRRHEKTH
ncbi:MAG: RNA methyltransferase [Acidobacteriia bacterium]|nr:RNA methyltransferase [Terriglobia bacterium]